MALVLAIDQGTTGTRGMLVDEGGRVVAGAYRAHRQHHPHPGWVEHDAREILTHVRDLVAELGAAARGERILGLALGNQGETVVAFDRATGEALGPAVVWQDLRTEAQVAALSGDAAFAREVTARTGLRLDPYFSAPKLRWLLDHAGGARELHGKGRLALATLDAFLLWHLGRGDYVTDESTASRTLLFDLHARRWDEHLAARFGVPTAALPSIGPSAGAITDGPIPVVASLVDQPAAMLGQGCLAPGAIKATFGTGCFVYMHAGDAPPRPAEGLLATLAWARDGVATYALDGGIFAAGALVRWLREGLGFFALDAELDALAAGVPDAGGVVCVPALAGLGVPHWRRGVRGTLLGAGLSTTRAHVCRAAIEGLACRVVEVVRAMERACGRRVAALRVDGGLSQSRVLLQAIADLLGAPVERCAEPEATAMGLAFLALRATGLWSSDDEITRRVAVSHVFEPVLGQDEREARLERFARATALAIAWSETAGARA